MNFVILALELAHAFFFKVVRPFYDPERRSARLARLSRRLALLEGVPGGAAAALLGGSPPRLANRKVRIIVNPISGRGMGMKAIPHLRRGFRELGFDVETIVTERAGQARQVCWALERNVFAVVAVGGDGTFNEVINGVGDQRVPIAAYATGTANCIAKEFGIPRNPELFCRMVAEGRTIDLDVGEHVGGRRFHSFAGIGFDAKVVEELSKRRTGAIALSTYAQPIASVVRRYDWPSVRVEVDGEVIADRAYLVIVSNIRNYAIMEVAGAADPQDGLLDVCVFQNPGFFAMLRYALGAFTRTHTNERDVLYVQGRRVRLVPDRPGVPVQVDGDNAGVLPAEFRNLRGAIRFLVPEATARKRCFSERPESADSRAGVWSASR